MTISHHFLNVQGLNLFVREKNPPLVQRTLLILHGWNTTGCEKWIPFIEHFPLEHTRIIGLDMPGFGSSQSPKTVWNAEDYADVIAQFISESQLDTPLYLIGHSFGGAVATILAAKYPHLVRKLILVAPAIVRSAKPSFKKQLITSISSSFKFLSAIPGLRRVWYAIVGSPDFHKTEGIMSTIMQQVIREDLQHWLSKISQKTLIIWGKKDTYTPYYQAQIINQQISASRLVSLPEINHGIHLHALPTLLKESMSFLEK